jgi:hypothetical protein
VASLHLGWSHVYGWRLVMEPAAMATLHLNLRLASIGIIISGLVGNGVFPVWMLCEQDAHRGPAWSVSVCAEEVVCTGVCGVYTPLWVIRIFRVGSHHCEVVQQRLVFMGVPLPANSSLYPHPLRVDSRLRHSLHPSHAGIA